MISALRQIFDYHCDPARPLALADLGRAVREMPVLSLRKYAYEHAFAFFWQELDTAFEPFDAECDRVEALCEGFRSQHFLAARIAHTSDRALIPGQPPAAGGSGMKISLCTISFRHQLIGLKGIACWARDNGFQGIELWAIHARNQSPLAIHNAQWMAAQGLSVPMISDYLPLHDPDLLRSRILLPRIAHYHLKNVSGRDRLGVFAPSNVYSAAGTRDGMVPLFEGAYDYSEFLAALAQEPGCEASLEWFGDAVFQTLQSDIAQVRARTRTEIPEAAGALGALVM